MVCVRGEGKTLKTEPQHMLSTAVYLLYDIYCVYVRIRTLYTTVCMYVYAHYILLCVCTYTHTIYVLCVCTHVRGVFGVVSRGTLRSNTPRGHAWCSD